MSTGKKVAALAAITIMASSSFAGLSAVHTETVSAATKPVKVTFWHAMAGPYKDALQKRIDAFNKSQSKYKITKKEERNTVEVKFNHVTLTYPNGVEVLH
ncbi:hypothetical protein BMS78_07890, partial [Leuconostoc pseudomesenteroides]